MLEQVTPWITPAIVLALFVWLRSDIRDLRREMSETRRDLTSRMDGLSSRMDSFDERLRALETGLAELRGRFDGIEGQLAFLRDYITGRNERAAATEAGADE